ncbi:hypothetical protein Tco_1173019 [Tanacetum coccineum]
MSLDNSDDYIILDGNPVDPALEAVVLPKFDMHLYQSSLNETHVKWLVKCYGIPKDLRPRIVPADMTIYRLPNDAIGLYVHHFRRGGLRVPFSRFFLRVVEYFCVHISQLVPTGVNRTTIFEMYCRALDIIPTVPLFRIMPPRMRTRSAGRPAAESLGGGTGERVSRGGRGRRPREGNDERVDELNGCSYKEFLACNPKKYDGKGGVVALTRWIEKMEYVHDMSGCSIDQKVEYTAGSFLESELWNHVMVGAGHAAYTDRFYELARLVPYLVTRESRMIKRYMCGLALQIRGMVVATEPKSMQKAVQISGALNDEVVRNGSIKKVEKRGNVGEPSKDRSGRDDNKRTRTVNAFATTVNPVGRENTGIIYQDDMDINRLMRTDELHKFSDDTLNHVCTAHNDIATGIQMEYLPKRKWSKQDKQRARVMINSIDKKLRDRRLMRSLEKFAGGRPYGGDLRLLQRTI